MGPFRVYTLQLAVLLAVVAAVPVPQETPKCGYDSCPKTKHGMINVHLVPHSHDDVGWLKTVDQYYYGSNTRIQRAGVQYILDTVVQELLHDPKKRFIQVESAFFVKWWKNQDDSTKHQVQKLVRSGQLEFIGGAWSMNDEACTNYQSVVDQFTWGYRFLNDTFGPCGRPRVAWQIDPFGHSRGFATILTQLGIDGVFFGRIDHEDKSNRLNQHTPEMVWRTSPNLGRKADLFTGVLFNNYSPPPGFCFDDLCADDPIIDDKKSPDYNVDTKVGDFIYAVEEQAKYYGTNQVILTMGGDFTYQAAHNYYSNLDKLIRYVNNRQGNGSNINVFYSTPSCYLKALHDANNTWTTKDDDFFPYASDPHAFWTGYFTSRPTHKFMERHGNNFLQVCKQLFSLAALTPEDRADLTAMREAMGIVQHHDAITGTEKQHVANDYARILSQGFDECGDVAEKALLKLTKRNSVESVMTEVPEQPPEFKSCLRLNTSQCEFSEFNDRFVVTIYNPLAQKENTYVRLPVQKGTYSVRCPKGKQQKVQLVPIPEEVVQTPGRVMSPATYELVFHAEHLPPLGFRSYYVEKTSTELPENDVSTEPVESSQIGFEQGVLVDVDDKGFMTKITKNGVPMEIKQNFLWYRGAVGDNTIFEKRASGAYIFRPNGTASPVASQATTKVYKGEIVHEVHQTFSPWVSQVIRTYANEKHVELIWNIGPIPIDDNSGKEIISRFDSPLESKKQFYTDTNGREMLQRTRDARPTWKLNLQEKISGNYYPINSRLSLRDPVKKQSLAVLVDRAEGGSSLKDGQLELMVHRRLLHDDAFGVDEALNETAFGKGLVARGTHFLFAGEEGTTLGRRSLVAQERLLSRRILLRSWLFFSSAKDLSFEQWQQKYSMEFSGVQNPLPHNVHLLTLEPWKGKSLLVRLEHFFERNEDHELSKPATVNLQDVFQPFKIISARETTLGGNQWLNDNNRMVWRADSNEIENEYPASEDPKGSLNVTLNPMEIRTFVVEIA